MKRWALQDAKARFGHLVEEAGEAPALITRNGALEAVLLSAKAEPAGKVVQGKRGAAHLLDALRAAPYALELTPVRGRFRPVKL